MSSRDYPDFPLDNIGIVENSEKMPKNSLCAENLVPDYMKDMEAIQYALNQSTMIGITDNQGSITFANDAFCRASGYSREELLGQDYRIINSGYHSPSFFRDLWSNIEQGRIWRGEIRNRAKDGHIYWENATIVPFRDQNGDVYRYVTTRHDITRRKEAEEQLNQMNQVLENRVWERTAELENLNRSLQAFSCMVSHDLKAPARKNSAFTKILLEEYQEQLDEAGQDYLRRIDMNSQRMSQLIDDFIRLSGIHYARLKRERVNLTDLAGRIIETLREQEPHRSVDVRIQPDLVIDGDESLLRILLENLLENAWKFTAYREKAVIELGMEQKEFKRVIFYVRDNGVGFDMSRANGLFQPFQRFHGSSEFPGTGIGLATVYQIIERHQGMVWIQSKVDQGATVYFLLPEGMEVARFESGEENRR